MQKSLFTFIITIIFFLPNGFSQQAVDFDVIDSDGQRHRLYEDYLDKGTTVVVKLFFINCPPCRSIAPAFQDLYEEWGAGEHDVEFFEFTVLTNDSSSEVAAYKTQLGLTMPGVGDDGGAAAASLPFRNGTYGGYYGTPSFAVISPNGEVAYGLGGGGIAGRIANLNAAIEATGATGGNAPAPSTFQFEVATNFGTVINDVDITLESQDGTVSYDIDPSNDLVISNLAEEYPDISNPYIRFKKTNGVSDNLSALDLFVIVRHILDKEAIEDDLIKLAADANGDGAISALDLFTIQRVILGKDSTFPNVDAYQFVPNEIEIDLQPGATQNFNIQAVKTGDVDGK